MIDFIKITIPPETAKDIQDILDFNLEVSSKTGEVKTKRTAEDQNLKFTFWDNYFQVSGSIHKHWHNDNFSQFTFEEFLKAVKNLHVRYGIDPTKARLKNLEVGVNLSELSVPSPQIIGSCIAHKGTSFNKMRTRFTPRAVGVEAFHQQYGIKVYDKAKQCSLPYSLLRVEIKFTRMSALNSKNIYYLSDLCKVENLPVLWEFLGSTFSEIVMKEPQLPLSKLSSSERRKIANYHNPLWWEEKRQNTSRQNYNKHHQRLLSIISQHVPVTTQEIILNSMLEKWHELAETKKVDELTDYLKKESLRINHSYKGIERQPRRCKITGQDISDQRSDSKFLSAKKIGYQEAHKLRNIDSNRRHNLKRKLEKYENMPTLFEVNEYLRLEPEQKEILNYWKGTKYEVKLG